MTVTINNEGAKTYVVIDGRIDTATAGEFQDAVAPLMTSENPDIEIDCEKLSYTSSLGLRMFLMLQKSVQSRSGVLVLKNMQPSVREVFDITGFSNIIKII
ncbi:MAG: STAS domain-containing protein [Bacteroidales bacterium]|nr:STAS domain-containing protein [Bacteroidales bacterium]